ncbi:Cyclic Amp-Responsive Element-Binding Protein 3-Like Protein 2, partial [Manis pentadactyla]
TVALWPPMCNEQQGAEPSPPDQTAHAAASARLGGWVREIIAWEGTKQSRA